MPEDVCSLQTRLQRFHLSFTDEWLYFLGVIFGRHLETACLWCDIRFRGLGWNLGSVAASLSVELSCSTETVTKSYWDCMNRRDGEGSDVSTMKCCTSYLPRHHHHHGRSATYGSSFGMKNKLVLLTALSEKSVWVTRLNEKTQRGGGLRISLRSVWKCP